MLTRITLSMINYMLQISLKLKSEQYKVKTKHLTTGFLRFLNNIYLYVWWLQWLKTINNIVIFLIIICENFL
jgi:hypothetical protein